MTPPGDRIRRILSRACSAQAMERVFDPVIADFQAEYGDAVRRQRFWEARVVRIRGCLALFNTLCLHAWTSVEYIEYRQTVATSIITFVGTALLLEVPFLIRIGSTPARHIARLAYLLPSAASFALVTAATAGIVRACASRRPSPQLVRRVLAVTLSLACVSLVNLGWIVPAGNQAFRSSVAGRPVTKGVNELTLSELRRLRADVDTYGDMPMSLVAPHDGRYLAVAYHVRWGLSFLVPCTAMFALALAPRRPMIRAAAAIAAFVAMWSYYVILWNPVGGLLRTDVPAWLVAWLPNLLVLALAGVLLGVDRQSLERRATSNGQRA